MANMAISNQCLALIEASEGFHSRPYLCPAGIPTIGFGTTYYPDGTHVTLKDAPITKVHAEAILRTQLQRFADAVNRYVKVPLTQGQFDALVDFAYNAGAGNLQSSTLLRKLNAGDYSGAKAEFGKWVYGGGKVLNGLVTRRAAEARLFGGATNTVSTED